MALTLDPVTVNTELAEKYLQKYNNFEAWPAPKKYWRVKKYPDNIVEFDIESSYEAEGIGAIGSYAARKIVEKIKKYESTFYQLEYLIRKTDKADFQNYMLLICQHLQCTKDSWYLGFRDQINILMTENTPLYTLGCVAAAKSFSQSDSSKVIIATTQKMAPICHLFTDICTQCGWKINLILINDIKDYFGTAKGLSINVFKENTALTADFGCAGVVTESADIDSALDVFIDSSVTAPWRLQMIFIQESVYEEAVQALAARSERGAAGELRAGGKRFAGEAAGERGGAGRVPLEPYRTARELAALLRPAAPRALSVWAADSQLAHEVALAAPAALVWLNEYASFRGPPDTSLPVYEPLYFAIRYHFDLPVLNHLQILWHGWSKLSKNERIDSIMNALQSLSSTPEGFESIVDFQDAILNSRDESFVSVDEVDGKICLCVERRPLFEDFLDLDVCKGASATAANAVKATIDGLAVVYGQSIEHSGSLNLLRKLEEAGVPVTYQTEPGPHISVEKNIIAKKFKVIRSNFGTIFAN